MAIIYSYPTVTPESGDLIVGTDITGKVTKNFTVGSIVSTEIPTYITGTTNGVPLFTSANTIGDSIINQNAGADKVFIGGEFDVSGGDGISLDGNAFLSIQDDKFLVGDWDENALSLGLYDETSTEILTIENGSVGIGTTSPTRTLDVNGEIGVKGEMVISSSSGFLDIGQYLATSVSKGLKFYADETLAMTIDTDTNVGIGTSAPSSKLDVNGTVSISNTGTSSTLNLKSSSAAPGGNYIHAKKSDNSNQWVLGSNSASTDRVVLKQYNDADIIFQNNNGDAMTINSNSYVGIGTTNPQATLDVNGVIAMKGTEQLLWDNNNGTLDIAPSVGQVKILTGVITIDYNSNVGINTTSPVSRLHVNGGDVEVDDSTSGLILKSPNGTRYRIKVDNSGNLTTTAV